MKETKKLTMGAMLLALTGAVMLLDRLLSFAFDELVFLMFAEVIIIYATMYTLKDGAIMAFGAVVLTMLFGGIYAYIYVPLGIIGGMAYAYGIKKDLDRSRLMLIEMGILIIGEVVITMLVMPLFGLSFLKDIQLMITSLSESLKAMGLLGLFEGILENLVVVSYIFGIIFMGVLEGVLVHLLSIYLLARFKIKQIKVIHLYALKIPPIIAYVSMAFVFLFFFTTSVQTHSFFLYLFITLALLGAVALVAMGYIFFIVYGSIVLGKQIGFYVILLSFLFFPYSLLVLLVIGFLYGSGPLKNYIERKRKGA